MLKQVIYLIRFKKIRHLFHMVMICHFAGLLSKVLRALYISKLYMFAIFPSSLNTINLIYALGEQEQ